MVTTTDALYNIAIVAYSVYSYCYYCVLYWPDSASININICFHAHLAIVAVRPLLLGWFFFLVLFTTALRYPRCSGLFLEKTVF